ncbi:MAG: hypothetical protein WAK94_18535 [Steroidobacteraceae bacterium]
MLEPLPDLSVETPLDVAPSRPGSKQAAAAPVAGLSGGLDDEEARALAFMDPDLQLAPSQAAARPASSAAAVVIPVPAAPRPRASEHRSIDESLDELDGLPKTSSVTPSTRPELTLEELDAAAAAAASAKPAAAPAAAPTLSPAPAPTPVRPELTLEERDVELVLASGSPAPDALPALAVAATPPTIPPAKPRAPVAAARTGTPRAAPVAPADAAAKRASVSLSTAAQKLAAASAASPNGRGAKAPSSAAPAGPVRAAPAASTGAASAGAAAPSAPPVAAPSLTDWASARAAAATKVVPTPAPAAPRAAAPPTLAPVPAAPVGAAAAPAAAHATAAAAATPAAAPSPPMDRDFITRNQVVERYLSGRLPLKGATEFERYCHDHPELLDEMGLPERVNAGLRLLEASGKPEPWQEAPRPRWQQPAVTIGLAVAVVALVIALLTATSNSAGKSHRIADLQKQVVDRTLDPATSTRDIRLVPSRSGASNSPAITIGGGDAQLADFRIDESHSPYHVFRVTIDRVDQGRVGVINNLAKDSNGHLRIALNSSALGPGTYQLTLEGLDWHGDPQPDSWVSIGVQH